MTLDEKLASFYSHSIDTANEQAAATVGDHQAVLNKLFEEHKETHLRQAEAEVSDEREKLKKEKNRILSAEQLEIKRAETMTAYEIREKVFKEIQDKLIAFKKTPEYITYLCGKLKDASDIAGDREAIYYISSTDADLVPELSQKTGLTLTLTDDDMIGGICAVITSKNLMIDYTLRSAWEEEKLNFRFDGGGWHE